MNVRELIHELVSLPMDAPVKIIYDGEARMDANVVYRAVSGFVVVTDCGETVYSRESRPLEAIEEVSWETPKCD